ncbi:MULTISPECIES: divergent polysaccharide deacetylase family protein [Bradyrhizobium]|uniref:Divergent polysaccharide deacetylase family protein n=1 Tax=Bradyrhizobium ottawaense TaxID=931866 RepID=A0A2U8P592_9BRAD|nr:MULTISPECIES: divergent polysaccharide deacetylase family protein [Bradyrhizobium]AWL92905.1 divergent polysaccharide deacetylase family protein [Bradyrhizobium ottawaense]MBR1293896.1 divergent polysaccharide deacetylase family protein [Bradyrhizobium ottawaense]MBR1326433.1 divergent polysaccharide deacetylase family protein [Bradyrhizobium ottawaense]MBR1336866.1 divergent polysaccharide deacetylase family protein [Bradyrhizobium ottawaense]MDA9415591.1 polysaccharide deacetylase [Bradyr
MTETADDLSAPLGQDKPRRKRRLRLPFTAMQALAVLLGLFLLTFAGFAIFNKDPLGGEPMTRIAISEKGADKAADEKPAAGQDSKQASKQDGKHDSQEAPKQAAPGEQKTVTMIDGSTGARHDVVIGEDAGDKAGAPSAPPPVMAGINPKLLEKSRYGMIPVVADGLKPFNVYAADADRAKAAKMPVVAIVIGGLGVGAAKTADAIMRLPAAVTLAFTPYGTDPGKLAERARAQRHEIFLQIPMEPYDFPDNDPGPQTLLTSLSADQNMDRLYWHFSRMQGYAGITNFMGARFVATEPAMQPIIREAAKRGLGFFDDGSSPRSIAAQAAANQAMPFGKGDIAIDVVPTPTEIDRALNKLESAARERGAAVGTASALPVSIERIGAWTKTLGDRGILLVPLTTAMLKSKSS